MDQQPGRWSPLPLGDATRRYALTLTPWVSDPHESVAAYDGMRNFLCTDEDAYRLIRYYALMMRSVIQTLPPSDPWRHLSVAPALESLTLDIERLDDAGVYGPDGLPFTGSLGDVADIAMPRDPVRHRPEVSPMLAPFADDLPNIGAAVVGLAGQDDENVKRIEGYLVGLRALFTEFVIDVDPDGLLLSLMDQALRRVINRWALYQSAGFVVALSEAAMDAVCSAPHPLHRLRKWLPQGSLNDEDREECLALANDDLD